MKGRIESEFKINNNARCIVQDMPQFIQEWYKNLQKTDKTLSSCYEYLRKINKFLEYINKDIKEIDISDITHQVCESYIISCQTKKDKDGMEIYTSNSYRRGIWNSLNSLLDFMYKNNYIEYNYMSDIKNPKNKEKQNSERILLTKRDFNKILDAVKNSNTDDAIKNRNILIIVLFMTTGIKRASMTEINVEDINFDEKTLTVIGNKNQVQKYDLSNEVINYIRTWLHDRERFVTTQSCDALFLKTDGSRLGDDTIYNIVRKSCYQGIGKPLPPNELRAGFCSILYKKTHNIEFVRNAVGHSSISSTKKYITERSERKKAVKIMSDILK